MMKSILQTGRLLLREFEYSDAQFILKLVNTPQWLEFIGDRGVHSEEDAIEYLNTGPLKSYAENGFGLWMVELKDSSQPIGMCGLIRRDTLDTEDIGFAMMPEYANKGYGFEIASATLSYAKNSLGLDKVVAITDTDNIASIRLLVKLGLGFVKTMISENGEKLLLFSTNKLKTDKEQIDQLTDSFFSVFTNSKGCRPQVNELFNLFIEQGMIVNQSKGSSEIYSLKEFVDSRDEILKSGKLIDFSEREVSGTTKFFNDIASRFLLYEKSGLLDGEYFETRGVKSLQYIRIAGNWKISSVTWCDE